MKRAIAGCISAILSGSLFLARALTIYTEVSPPHQEIGPNGELQGFSVDIVREIQKRVDNHDPIQVVPWVRGYNEIQNQPNVVLFSMARSSERDPLFEWVGPLYETTHYFYVRADSKIQLRNLEDARKLGMIGVYKEDIRDQYLTRLGFTNLDRSLDQGIMFKKLMSGRVDAIAGTPQAMDKIAMEAGVEPQNVKPAFSFLTVQGYIAFSKTTPPETVKAWAAAFQAMKKDGTFARIFKRYFPSTPLPDPSVRPF
jgi:polar amino acid transport system substrate-binding protein